MADKREWDEIDEQASRESFAMRKIGQARKQWGVTSSRYGNSQGGGIFYSRHVVREDRAARTQVTR